MDSPLAYIFADGNLPSLPLSCSSTSEELQQRLHSISLELESVREAAKLQSKLNESKLSQLQGMLETARKERDEAWLECVKLQECHFRLSNGTTTPPGNTSTTRGGVNNAPSSPCSLVQSISSASTSSTPKQARQNPKHEAPLCLQQDMNATTCIDDCMSIFDKDGIFPHSAGFVKQQSLPKLNTDVPSLPKSNTDVPSLPKLNTDVPSLPKFNTDVPSFPKLDTDLHSLPKLNTELSLLNTDMQKLKREMPSLPKLSTDMSSLSKINSDTLSSLPKLNSDMSSLPILSTDMSSLSKLNSDMSSLPKLDTDIFNDDMDLDQPKCLDVNNIPIDKMVCDTSNRSGKMKWEPHLPTSSSSNGTLTRQSSCISSSGCLLIRQSSCLSMMVNSQSWDSVESPRMPATLASKQSLPMPHYQIMAKQQPHHVQLGMEPHKAPPILCRRPLFPPSHQGLTLPSAENLTPPFTSEAHQRSSALVPCNDITDLVHRNTNIMPVSSTDKNNIHQTPMALNKHDILQILQPDVKVKPGSLPDKGYLLQAVMQAGPLLQTLLLAGPLPEFKHPPPQLTTLDLPKLPQFSPNKTAPGYTSPMSPMSIVNNVRSSTLQNTLGSMVPYGLVNGTNPVDLTSPFGATAAMISSTSKMNMMDSAKASFLRSRKLRKPNPVAVR